MKKLAFITLALIATTANAADVTVKANPGTAATGWEWSCSGTPAKRATGAVISVKTPDNTTCQFTAKDAGKRGDVVIKVGSGAETETAYLK